MTEVQKYKDKNGAFGCDDLIQMTRNSSNKMKFKIASVPFHEIILKHRALKKWQNNEKASAVNLLLNSHDSSIRDRVLHYFRNNVYSSYKSSKDKPKNSDNGFLDYQEDCLKKEIPDIQEILKDIPKEWTIVQITSLPTKAQCFSAFGVQKETPQTPDFIIARYSKLSKEPLFAHITPFKSSPSRDGTIGLMAMLNELIQDHNHANRSFRDDKALYWQKRHEHHKQMQQFIRAMELEYVGSWVYLLLGSLPKDYLPSNFDEAVEDLVKLGMSPDHAEAIVASLPYMSLEDLCTVHPAQLAPVENLKIWLKKYQKIKKVIEKARRDPVILILDKVMQGLPWESLECLKNQSVTRVPSLSILKILLDRHKAERVKTLKLNGKAVGCNPPKAFYVLNPEGDLRKVQERLEGIVKAIWGDNGTINSRPDFETLQMKLETEDLFVYLGHGSGTQYIRGDKIVKKLVRPVVTLFGCSSAKMVYWCSRVDPMGTVIHYLIAGAPCCLGMLWEVTDLDCDRMTVQFWQYWLGNLFPALLDSTPPEFANCFSKISKGETEQDLARCASMAKEIASSYINRCALVVYGLPTESFSS
ncbi:separin-like [Artemia franciscana]